MDKVSSGTFWVDNRGNTYVVSLSNIFNGLHKDLGLLYYLQEIGCVGGIWASPEYIISQMKQVTLGAGNNG